MKSQKNIGDLYAWYYHTSLYVLHTKIHAVYTTSAHQFITSHILMSCVSVLTCDPTVFLFERPPFGACLIGWVVADPARDFFSLGSTFSSNSSATSSNYKHRNQFTVTIATFKLMNHFSVVWIINHYLSPPLTSGYL